MTLRERAGAAIRAWRRRDLTPRMVSGAQLRSGQRRDHESFRINDPSSRIGGPMVRRGPLARADREKLWRVFRYNPFARKAMSTILNGAVAYGIIGSPVKPTKALKRDWEDWLKVCDWDGVLDFYGLQELFTRTYLLDGVVFVVLRVASGVTGNPLRLQLLSVDQLATPVTGSANIQNGIEFDRGRPVAYHFLAEPADRQPGGFALRTERIPAADVIHFFERMMPGLWWGWPHFEPVLEALAGVDDYLESEGVRKRIESCFMAMVTRSIDATDASPLGGVEGNPAIGQQGEELRVESVYPGMILYGQPGEGITFGEPKAAGGFSDYLRWAGIRAAAGSQVPYEGLTGDLSNVSFISGRLGQQEFKRFIGRLQWTVGIIPRVLDPIWERFCKVQVDTGRMPDRPAKIVWTPPAFEPVSPKEEAEAAILEMQAGLESRRSKLGERGYDHDTKAQEIAEDLATTKKLGLGFKGDPFTPGQATGANENGDGSTAGG